MHLRPVGTNLVLVRRVIRANNLLSMKTKRATRAERLTAWCPRAPGGVQGQSPGGGAGGRAPGSSWVLVFVKGLRKALLEIFFSLNQPTSAWYRNVSIK